MESRGPRSNSVKPKPKNPLNIKLQTMEELNQLGLLKDIKQLGATEALAGRMYPRGTLRKKEAADNE
jgi:hypothetical protein